jgi:formamidopyrimidine-DNA glycosylase|tara:strand:- start:3411 stop:4220 length:810 start_codon:yes stop_codon:yes gene_type:complete
MPELPEVETTVRAINKFSQSTLNSTKIHNRNLRWRVVDNFELLTKNKTINKISRRAKYIIFYLDDINIILHLGMSGSLRIARNNDNFFLKHDHAEFIFDKEKIVYNDPRRFGSIHLTDNLEEHRLIKNLGPEPLSSDFNAQGLYKITTKSKINIKSLLMNQKNVVGIGNIYASESLYLAKINPSRIASELSIEDCKKVTHSAKKILNSAIKVGGTTLKDFYSADGSPGYFKFKLNVYGREGLECKKCSTLISKAVINTRATFFCKNCQN